MTRHDTENAKQALLKLREGTRADIAAGESASDVVELDQSKVGRLSRMDAMQAQAMAQAAMRRHETTLKKIEAAFLRIDEGLYGSCQNCEKPIAQKRLEFDPTALFCIDCAEQAENSA